MSGLYISLNQGVTEYRDKYGDKTALEFLSSNAEEFRNKIDVSYDLEKDISLGNGNFAPFYEAGNIYSKYYSADHLPTEEVIISDSSLFCRFI